MPLDAASVTLATVWKMEIMGQKTKMKQFTKYRKCEREYSRKLLKRDKMPLKKYYKFEQCHRISGGVKQKRCRMCMKWKPHNQFYKTSRLRDGLAPWCKQCADKATNDCRRRRTQQQRAALIAS